MKGVQQSFIRDLEETSYDSKFSCDFTDTKGSLARQVILLLREKDLILLLSFDESFLEEVGIYGRGQQLVATNLSGSKETALTFAVCKADGECLRLRLSLADICCRVPYPTPVATNIG